MAPSDEMENKSATPKSTGFGDVCFDNLKSTFVSPAHPKSPGCFDNLKVFHAYV